MHQALIAAVSALIGVTLKSVWDWFYARRREMESLGLIKQVDFRERQLAEFYWPIFIRLEQSELLHREISDSRGMGEQHVKDIVASDVLIPIHDEIVKIIELRTYVAEAETDLRELLLQYVRDVTSYKAMCVSEDSTTVRRTSQAPASEQLHSRIRMKTMELQERYEYLLFGDPNPYRHASRATWWFTRWWHYPKF